MPLRDMLDSASEVAPGPHILINGQKNKEEEQERPQGKICHSDGHAPDLSVWSTSRGQGLQTDL